MKHPFVYLAWTMLGGLLCYASASLAAEVVPSPAPKRPCYGICSDVNKNTRDGNTGKDFHICEDCLKQLNEKQVELSCCRMPEIAGFPVWPVEAISVQIKLPLIHSIEKARMELNREILPDFSMWQNEFLMSLKNNQIKPELHKAQISHVEGNGVAIAGYTRDANFCGWSHAHKTAYNKDWGGRGFVYFELQGIGTDQIRQIDSGFDSPFKIKMSSCQNRHYFVRQRQVYEINAPDSVYIAAISERGPD